MWSTELTAENGLGNPGSSLQKLTGERRTCLTGAFPMPSRSPPTSGKKISSFLHPTGGFDFSKWLGLGREVSGSRNLIMGCSQTLMGKALYVLLPWLLIWKKTLW